MNEFYLLLAEDTGDKIAWVEEDRRETFKCGIEWSERSNGA